METLDSDGNWTAHSDLTPARRPGIRRRVARCLGRRVNCSTATICCRSSRCRSATSCCTNSTTSTPPAGWSERFHPGLYRVTSRCIERVTGRPVPQFKPKPLFYQQPIYYMSNAKTFVPTGTPVAMPDYSRALDFELEIGFVLAATVVQRDP